MGYCKSVTVRWQTVNNILAVESCETAADRSLGESLSIQNVNLHKAFSLQACPPLIGGKVIRNDGRLITVRHKS
jgi:hypothetical protein